MVNYITVIFECARVTQRGLSTGINLYASDLKITILPNGLFIYELTILVDGLFGVRTYHGRFGATGRME